MPHRGQDTLEPRPLYLHIKQHILERVRTGAWPPGERVPSENQLVAQFGVSRMTANRALRELMQEGVLSRLAGVGTFVKQAPRRTSLIEIRNIADEIRSRGREHHARVHIEEEVRASQAQAEPFELPQGSRLFRVVIVHYENALPVQIEDRFVNPALAPDFLEQDFTQVTPTAYLVDEVEVEELEHTVEAVLPTPQQQFLLAIGEAEPCLALYRRSWARAQVVTLAELTYPASRYALYSRYRPDRSGSISLR